MKKRIIALLLAFVMLVGVLPMRAIAVAADLPVSTGRVDITDTPVGSYTLQYLDVYLQNTYEAVKIVSATQDGTTIDIVLPEDTDPNAALQAGFGGSGSGMLSQSGNKCTLSGGTGTMTCSVAVRLGPQMTGSATFTINFTIPMGEACAVTPPTEEGVTFAGKDTAYKDSAYSFQVSVKEGYDGTNMTVSCKSGENTVEVTSDGNGSYTIASVPGDITIQVSGVVAKTKYTITRELCQGVTVTGPEWVYAGDPCNFTVAVDGAYDASNMVIAVDGETVGYAAGEYKIDSVTADTKITVTGVEKKNTYTVSLTEGENYTISGQATSYAGEPYTFTVTVDDAVYWADQIVVKVNGEPVTLTGGKYTFPALDGDKTVTVENVVERKLFTVTKPEAAGVTFTGNDSVREGKPYTFCVAVDTVNYLAASMNVTVNGEPVALSNGSYTIPSASEDIAIVISGVRAKEIYTVIKVVPEGMDGITINGNDTVLETDSYQFTVTVPELYNAENMAVTYRIGEVTENLKADNGTYTIPSVTGNVTVTVSGLTKKDVCVVEKPTGNKFTFEGADFAYKGSDYTFTVTPQPGYEATVTANGEAITGTNGQYTVKADGETLTLAVTTNRLPLPDKELTVTDNGGSYTAGVTANKIATTLSNNYSATVTGIKVTGAVVNEAFEDGRTVYFMLDKDTPNTATVDIEFLHTTSNRNVKLVQSKWSLDLKDGEGSLKTAITVRYSSFNRYDGTSEYTLIFFREIPAEEPPARIVESDTAEVWKGWPLELKLNTYFTDADTYYLVEGETKTQIEGSVYTYTSPVAGEQTLVFLAENEIGLSEPVTVTVSVRDVESGIYINHSSGNGSLDSVQFYNADGEPIEGIEISYDQPTRVITVVLPKDYEVNGTVKAKFQLTQNASGYPYVSQVTETVANRPFGSRFTEKSIQLTSGAAEFVFYYYNKDTGAVDAGGQTRFTISIKMKNDRPVLAEGVEAAVAATVTAGQEYALNLSPIFTDIDKDTLTYQYKVDSGDWQDCDAGFTYSNAVAAEYVLTFRAFDTKDYSAQYYTVTLTVENVKDTYDMTVCVPAGLEPKFYISTGFADGVDQLGDAVEGIAGKTADGMTAYTLSYPQNAAMLSIRTDGWGGMAFPAEENGTVTLRQVTLSVVDYEEIAAESTNTVTYGEYTAVAGADGWLLVTGREYTYTAVPKDAATLVTVTETETLEAGADVYTREMMLNIKNPITITVPTNAKAQLYNIDTNKYYVASELDAKIVKNNGDGTTTYFFVGDTKASGTCFVYRVSMDGKITKVGYMAWGKQSATVTYTDADKADTYRLDDYSGTGYANSAMTEDSVLLNINSRNNLSLSVGETKTLKAYRAWEIIKISYQNYILTPDFTYTILSGSDVVSLSEKKSPSTADGDWMTLTALKPGVAVIEVTYGAMEVTGGSYDGIYGASDPARTGIVVVQVGGNDSSVDFGIDCFASAGKGYADHIAYNPGAKRVWDAEFDTLYFTGSSGELELTPSASGDITEVAVSHDKGGSWDVLTGENGTYTATILSGNNILRVKTSSGTAYQVVRGDQISVSLKEADGKSDGDGIVEAGESVRVSLIGLHMPIPKMAGNYNPGFGGNTDGYSGVHLNYTANGAQIHGVGSQYTFVTSSNYVEITMPEDGSSVTLSDGYIGVGVIGLTAFTTGGDSHRNIPDSGCGTRGSETTFHTRSILPEITIEAGGESAPNCAPVVRADAVTEGSIYDDQKFAINPDTLFQDADGDALTFTVSVDGGEATEIGTDYKFVPEGTGSYKLTFAASDGEYAAEHTITVTVTQRPKEEDEENKFDLEDSEIAGYVTISFEDNGIRVEGEKGLKFPVPLGTIIEPTKVPYKEGENIAQVTKRLLDHLGIGMEYSGTLESGFYLGAITNFEVDGTPYASMAEFDAGVGSGWMITQNATFINQGASEFKVNDGDILKWQYSCQLGADIGDDFYAAVNATIKLIDEIGAVTLDSGAAIQAARAAYNKLSENEKERVSNYQKLIDAEAKYAQLVKTAEDEAAAKAVEDKIAAIGVVTLDSEDAIKEARAAYDALTDVQKALVGKLAVLEAAEEALELLKLSGADITDIYKTTGDYLAYLSAPGVGNTNGEWRVIGLARAGRSVADSYYDAVAQYVKDNIDGSGRLHAVKSTDNSRLIVALTAIGKDVTDVGGYDLLSGLDDMTYIGKQGINGTIWALIAFDTHNYEIPAGDVTREKLVQTILDAQKADGGWALSGAVGDPDMTGMALQALAPYYRTNSSVKTAVDKALAWLSEIQNQDGTFTGSEGTTSESLAQVITGLTALGINPETDSRFVKSGVSAVDALSRFYVEGGGFKHELAGQRNMMATEQSYYAFVSYYRFLQNKTALYDMSDVTIQTAAKDQAAADAVEMLIDAIGTVTRDSAEKIKAARDAYDALTEAQKCLVENYKTLTDAEVAYAQLIKTAEDEAAAKAVEDKINAIGTVTLDSEGKIKEARKAYDALTNVQKALVSNLNKLEAAEKALADLKDEAAANEVEKLIDAIGTVTLDSEDTIQAARTAYDALTEKQKKLVKNYKTLTDAESRLQELKSTVSVSFTLLGCYKHGENEVHTLADGNLSIWIARKAYMVAPGATVKDVLEKALTEAGMSWRNPTGNYVESINGIGEFTNGSNSGWMYTLNGIHPGLSVAEQTVQDGDVLVFHYTDDYTREGSSQGFADQDEAAAESVEKLIDAIGTVTLNSKVKIDAARKAYDALTYTQKQLVSNYATLTAAENAYAQLKKADDEKKAREVEALIDKIDDETDTFEEDVLTAKAAYDGLTPDQKKLVRNSWKLMDALKKLASEEDKKAAEEVEKLINAIGTVTLDSEDAIKAACKAYEMLTDAQKALVGNLAVLESAVEKLAALKALAGVEEIYNTTGDYLEKLGTPLPGTVGGEWMVIGLIRSGRVIKDVDAYYEAAVRYVQENIDENERLHSAKSTENARMILALTAIGKDAANVDGHNLLGGLNDMDYVCKQGINGPIWALIAFDSGNYPTPEGNVTRKALIQVILDAQLPDGGWALSGSTSDADITGMALQALAPYYTTDAKVKAAVDEALETLSMMQAADGSFGSIDGVSAESVAQVVAGLSALGIDPHTDARFLKNGISAIDALCAFYVEGGGFKHIPDGALDGMATEQSYYALTAYFRMLENKTALYDMTDVIDMGGDVTVEEPVATLPAETEPAPTEPVDTPAKEDRSFPWWLVIVIVVLAGAIVVLVIISKPKKGGHRK